MMTVRLPWRQVVLITLVLCVWAPFKLAWEIKIQKQQDELRYHGVVMTRELRDQISQDLTFAVFAGLRSVVADIYWLRVTEAWEKYQWFKMENLINTVTSLQPRAILFWQNGGWQLAWNVSIAVLDDPVREPNQLRRVHDSLFWIDRGLDVFKRGLEANPDSWELWKAMGELYQNRLHDYYNAAYCYQRASEIPGSQVFLERMGPIMMGPLFAKDDWKSYELWKELWFRLTPAQREEKAHWKEKIITNIKDLENKLNIPDGKRVFPK